MDRRTLASLSTLYHLYEPYSFVKHPCAWTLGFDANQRERWRLEQLATLLFLLSFMDFGEFGGCGEPAILKYARLLGVFWGAEGQQNNS